MGGQVPEREVATTQAAHRPSYLSEFVGRRAEVDALRALLHGSRLVSIVGPGGIGKTRLALQVLEEVAADTHEPAWAVELADLADPELLGHTVAAAMGVAVMSTSMDPQVLVAHVHDRPALLLLDNCEHLVDACAALVETLVAGCPELRILVTSRQSLGVMGERLFPVAGLRFAEAAELFHERARAVLPDWRPGEQERADVAALCRQLEGSPLAIEVAAAQTRTFSPAMMIARIRDEAVGSIGAPGVRRSNGQTTLHACMEWSHHLCTPEEAQLWERLAVFAGGFSLEAAEDVCSGEGLDRSRIVWALAGLVDKSLVERDVADRNGRYRMHEIVRQFGRARLLETGQLDRWRRRHRDHFLTLAKQFDTEWIGPNQHDWVDRLRRDHANLGAAFDFGVAGPVDAPAAMQMATMLEPYYACSDSLGVVLHWLRLALAHDSGSEQVRAEALRFGCHMATILADAEVVARMHDEAARLGEQTDDERVRASALYAGTVGLTFQGRPDQAAELGVEGIGLLAKVGDLNRQVYLCYLLGKAYSAAGRLDDAATAFRACLDLAQPRGERWMSGYATFGLGQIALAAGNLDEATDLLRSALRIKADFQDHLALGLILEALAWVGTAGGQHETAAYLAGAADAIWSALGTSMAAMPYLAERRTTSVAASREALSEDTYDQWHEAGRRSPFDVVLRVAAGEAGLPPLARDLGLTSREQEIAGLLATGASNREIADRLVLSVRTVESHVERILRKLDVRSRTEVRDAIS